MKTNISKKKNNKNGIMIVPRFGIILFCVILFASFVYTQANRTEMSSGLLYFLFGVCIADLLLFFVSCFLVSATVVVDGDVCIRKQSKVIDVYVDNKGLIPISAVELRFSFPRNDGVKSEKITRRLSLLPFSSNLAKLETVPERRGIFRVGIDRITVFDFLGFVKAVRRLDSFVDMTVIPKSRDSMPFSYDTEGSREFDENVLELNSLNDYGDIREYRPGDSMKKVHWKLSTKTEELQVKKFLSESRDKVSVVCIIGDQSGSIKKKEDLYEAFDATVEYALTVAESVAVEGSEGNIYFNGDFCKQFSEGLFDSIYASLSTYGYDYTPFVFAEELFDSGSILAVFGFSSLDDGKKLIKFFSQLKSCLTLCLLDLSVYLDPSDTEEYKTSLSSFCKILTADGINYILLKAKEERI